MSAAVMDKLDREIQALEEAAGFKGAEGTQAEADAAAQPSSFTMNFEDVTPPPASGPVETPQELVPPVDQSDGIGEEPTSPSVKKRVSWKNRYTKLKAFHDSSRFKDRQVISTAFERIAALEKESVKSRSELETFRSKDRESSIESLVTPEERDIIGDAGVSSIDKLTQRAVDAAVAPLKAQLALAEQERIKASDRTAANARMDAKQIFKDQLGQVIPDYGDIDQDPQFEVFLGQPDPLTGQKRFSLFKQAQNAGDVGRVADFFRDYKALKAIPRQTLESKVTPVGNVAPPVGQGIPAERDERIYSIGQYNAFMDDLTKGKFAGKQAEADQMETMFDVAHMEGRVR